MSEFIAITFFIMLAAISPGPDFAMIVKNSLLYSRKVGIFTALGVSCSLFIHSSYSILGLAIIISQSLLAFNAIKFLGAAYLIYIGIKSLLAKREVTRLEEQRSNKSIPAFTAFRQGFLCNLLNPKAIMFILAFFTLIIKPTTPLYVQIGYGVEITLINFIWFSSLSIMFTHKYVRNYLGKIQHYIVKIMGGVLIGFGLRIATLVRY